MAVYEGSEQYIFVSYAHKDSETVIPIINALQSAGFRVWYDQGIQAGTEWPEYIEDHLNKCKCVLVCMSPATIESINCRNEINYACMLKKDMLIVYLEETVLAKGMNLQLNSQQSLFRYRHTSDETFLAEVIKATILQSCKENSEFAKDDLSFLSDIKIPVHENKNNKFDNDISDRTAIISKKLNCQPVISRVGTLGSNFPNDAWPKGVYSGEISTSKFSTVHFHCNLIRPCATMGIRNISLRIFDSHDNLVFDRDWQLKFNVGDDKFSLSWLVKDQYGLSQTADTYTAVIWIDNSRAYEYTFKLTEEKALSGRDLEEVESLKKKLKFPKLFLLNLITSILGVTALSLLVAEPGDGVGFILAIPWFVLMLITCNQVRKIAFNKRFLPFLCVTFGGFYFGIYLFVMTIICWKNRKNWNERIKELQTLG